MDTNTLKNFGPNVAAAWAQAGALVGWLTQSEFGAWEYLTGPNSADSLPVFLFQKYDIATIATLLAPSVPFALCLQNIKLHNADLKKLSGLGNLQNLRALDLSHTLVDDLGLTALAKFQNLQSVDLGATTLTDEGLSLIHI